LVYIARGANEFCVAYYTKASSMSIKDAIADGLILGMSAARRQNDYR